MDAWKFLVGEWRGASKDQFGEKGVIETVTAFSAEPGERFLTARGESRCEGRLLNRSLSVLFYDSIAGKFRRETFFSYGFVNHETEYARGEGEIRFDVRTEPSPKQFEGLRWRSFLRKVGDAEIATGLEVAKPGEDFRAYGETRLRRIP